MISKILYEKSFTDILGMKQQIQSIAEKKKISWTIELPVYVIDLDKKFTPIRSQASFCCEVCRAIDSEKNRGLNAMVGSTGFDSVSHQSKIVTQRLYYFHNMISHARKHGISMKIINV